MFKSFVPFALTALFSTIAIAQTPMPAVGSVQSVNGLATVGQANTIGNAAQNQRILDGARLVTTSSGTLVVKLDNGCIIRLNPNQAVTINSKLDCPAIVAGIQSTLPATAAAGSAGADVGNGIIVGTGIIVTGLVISEFSRDRLSGN